jgi:hypothetical protein
MTNTFTPDEPVIIHTFHPEDEIWHYISKLAVLDYVRELLKDRVKNNFFGLDIVQLIRTKEDYNEKLKAKTKEPKENSDDGRKEKEADIIEIHQPLSDAQDIHNNAVEIVHTTKQAIEIYRASQSVSLYAKPILLYYSYTRLARVLYLSTYKQNKSQSATHGLTMKNNDIICLRSGAFTRFHDSYSSRPSIYLDQYTFGWQDLLDPPIDRFRLFEIINKANGILGIKERRYQKTEYPIHELTREIIFTYAISMLARYRITKWNEIIEGIYEKKDLAWKIKDYLRQTQSFFPNLIFNKLHGQRYSFFPEPRLGSNDYRPSVYSDGE